MPSRTVETTGEELNRNGTSSQEGRSTRGLSRAVAPRYEMGTIGDGFEARERLSIRAV